jgi:hypothetical protein
MNMLGLSSSVVSLVIAAVLRHIASERTAMKTPLPTVLLLLRRVAIAWTTQRTPLPSYTIVVCYKSLAAIT